MTGESQPAVRTAVLRLDGRCTIERADELKSMLLESLSRDDAIVIDLENLTEVDLSCLQLLCAAHRRSLRQNKQMQLGADRPVVFDRAVRTAGFARTLGCHKDPGGTCLWKGVWKE
ncbi:MAG: lipid asymmetry maintenance protein MlaB [Syntrophobacteraceae bacterium]